MSIMSVVTHNVLKLLSDLSAAADRIVEENASEVKSPRIEEWTNIVKNKADNISESGSSASGETPGLKSFLKGKGQRGLRVSTVLTEIQKSHLHRKGKTSVKTGKKSRKSSTPFQRKSNARGKNETIIIDSGEDSPKMPPTIIDKTEFVLNQNASTSTSSVEKETTIGSFTPVYESTISMDKRLEALRSDKGSSKRKSSPEISLNAVKKPRTNNDPLSDPKSTKNAKVEKLTKAKVSSSTLLSNNANVATVSVLKENRTLRSKMETKQDKALENRKNIMALRKQKLEENKRTREEKLEKTIQQRMKLEQEKIVKLRSGGGREKLLKNSKEATPKANAENGKKSIGGRTSNCGKNKEKQTAGKKMIQKKATGTSALKINEKTPEMKNLRQETQKVMNTTYVSGEGQSTSNKKVTLKDGNIGTNSGNKMVSKTLKQEQTKQPISTPAQKKDLESYALTPARSSFVSYDISEIRSDSEDEEQEANSKPIPSWATGVRLRNTLLQQHHDPIDTDELFGNYFDPPDLVAIMGVKKKHYNKRTSSAIWNSSFAFDQ